MLEPRCQHRAHHGCALTGQIEHRQIQRKPQETPCFLRFSLFLHFSGDRACIKDYVFIDPACGSGGMFVQTGDFVNHAGMNANSTMTFYGQEKVEYNAQLCLMNMAVHGLAGVIKSGDEANTFYHDAHNLNGCCDYVMANQPFNVDKVNAESAQSAGRLPFGLPSVNAKRK